MEPSFLFTIYDSRFTAFLLAAERLCDDGADVIADPRVVADELVEDAPVPAEHVGLRNLVAGAEDRLVEVEVNPRDAVVDPELLDELFHVLRRVALVLHRHAEN